MIEKLTPREIQILELFAKGAITKQLADDLNIKYNTLKSQRSRIIRKLNANSMEHAVAMLYEHKIKRMKEGTK